MDDAEGRLVPVVLMPRFTSLVGAGVAFPTFPIDVTAYEKARLSVWRGALVGASSPTFGVEFSESTDRDAWYPAAGTPPDIDPGTASEMQIEFPLGRRWLRAVVLLGGGVDSAVTCWIQGFLVRRET